MYNETDLKTIWFAYKGGMKKYQVAQLMGITEDESVKMLAAAQEKYGKPVVKRHEPGKRRAYFHDPVFTKDNRQPFQRPAAKYDNKSSEERINELLNTEI